MTKEQREQELLLESIIKYLASYRSTTLSALIKYCKSDEMPIHELLETLEQESLIEIWQDENEVDRVKLSWIFASYTYVVVWVHYGCTRMQTNLYGCVNYHEAVEHAYLVAKRQDVPVKHYQDNLDGRSEADDAMENHVWIEKIQNDKLT